MIQLNLTPPECFGCSQPTVMWNSAHEWNKTTQDGLGGDFKPCFRSHDQSYTKAVVLKLCFRNSMEIPFWWRDCEMTKWPVGLGDSELPGGSQHTSSSPVTPSTCDPGAEPIARSRHWCDGTSGQGCGEQAVSAFPHLGSP